jgi:hypothetical protein
MLTIYEYQGKKKWDEDFCRDCCDHSKPTPCDPPGSDCCYDTWKAELAGVTWEYNHVTKELQHVQKYLDVITARTTRLKTWFDELYNANELARKICYQLEIIEAQVINICINTKFTVKAIEILYCMIREFYVEVDCLVTKYECLMNCIKCLNCSAITPTQGIGKVLTDYGTALTALVNTRDNLLKMVMAALALAEQLHWEICDNCGFKRLIVEWQETLHCGVPCEAIPTDWPGDEEPEGPCAEEECLFPILEFPLCNTEYYGKIDRLYKADKKKMNELTEKKQKLTKRQMALAAAQQSLQTALKEADPAVRCS